MTSNSIEQIRRFLKQNGVKYYDVQMELVDHFMTSIEQSELSFDEALDKVYKDFDGKSGLKKIVKQKKTLLFRKFLKMYIDAFKAYFSLPKVLLTFLVFIGSYFLVYQTEKDEGFFNLVAQLFNVFIIFQTSFKFGVFKEAYKKDAKFLILVIQEYFQIILIIPVIVIMLYSFDFSYNWNKLGVVAAMTLATIGVLSYNSIRRHLTSQMELYYPKVVT